MTSPVDRLKRYTSDTHSSVNRPINVNVNRVFLFYFIMKS